MNTIELLEILMDIFEQHNKLEYQDTSILLDIERGYFYDLFFEYGYSNKSTIRKYIMIEGDVFCLHHGDISISFQQNKWNDIKENKDNLNYLILMMDKDIKYLFDDIWPEHIKELLLGIKDGIVK